MFGEDIFAEQKTPNTSGSVLVTGASSGIGRAAARALAEAGVHVFAGVRKESDAASIKQEFTGTSLSVTPIMIDVAKDEDISRVAEELSAKYAAGTLPTPFAIVNNAGLMEYGTVEAFKSMDRLDTMLNVNVRAPLALARALMPLVRGSQGRLCNVGSIGGELASGGMSIYAGTKFAIRGWTDGLRRELIPSGAWAATVEPGFIRTAMVDAFDYVVSRGKDLNAEQKRAYSHVYSKDTQATWAANRDMTMQTTDATDEAIVHCVTSPFPRAKYMVQDPVSSIVFKIMYRLPEWMQDRVMALFASLGPKETTAQVEL